MKVVRFHEEGGPELPESEDLPVPEPDDGEVLLHNDVTGMSYAEVLQRQGKFRERVPLPYTLGHRVVGTVEKVGRGVDASMVGKQYIGMVTTGAYAEYALAKVGGLKGLPPGASPEGAFALLSEAHIAALALRVAGKLQPGETIFVPAATGSVGYMAVQLAQIYGASKVLAGASTDEKRAVVAKMGAIPVDYTKADWPQEVIALTDGKGVDLSLEANGGQFVYDTLAATRAGGRMVNFGNITDTNAPVNPRQLLRRNQALIGFSAGSDLFLEEREVLARELDELIVAGKLTPLIAGRFTLENVQDGHKMLENRESIGKVILLPNG